MDQRIGRLLDAVLAVSRDLDLEAVLTRVVRSACELVEARYGALGVIASDGDGLEAFVHHGVEAATVQRIGHLPEGHGMLGLLIRDPRPIRLDDITEHADSYGFPPGHPEMRTFLGVPVLVRGEVYGNLYLSEKVDGEAFTEADEQLVVGLAGVAGAAIANARLYDDIQRREAWRDGVIELSSLVLSGATRQQLRDRVVQIAATLVGASGSLLVGTHDEVDLWVLASTGDAPGPGFLPSPTAPVRRTLADGEVVRADDSPLLGMPTMWVPVEVQGAVVAALGVGRADPLDAREEQMLRSFADQASVAWGFERAQTDLKRLHVVEDRERIGRDLHDTVIQRLFATGLSLQGTIRRFDDRPELAERLSTAVDDIDVTVKEIRSTIFALQSTSSTRGVRSEVMGIVEEVAAALPRAPRVRFEGPIDTVVSDEVRSHLVPVVRELLSNVVKHADATDVEVELAVDAEGPVLRVADDGRGIDPGAARGFGLDNLAGRAEQLGGSFELRPGRHGRGTSAEWRVPSR